jgi:hypothetical protein
MKNIIEISKIFPNYRFFKSLSHPKRYYAVLKTDVEWMEKIRTEFPDHRIPDSYTVKALPLATDENNFSDVFDHHPTLQSINDLIEEVFAKENAKL